jgi:hypothetical protein|nr:MAG TPA: hypothetical protein [Crassvirales sp.]
MNKKIKSVYVLPPNYYGIGGLLDAVGAAKGSSSNIIGAIGAQVGGAVGGAIGGGLKSGAGSLIGGLGDIASKIPGPWGAIAGAGLKVIGGLTDRAFGSKINEENVKEIEGVTNSMNNFKVNASNFDDLSSKIATTTNANNFSDSYVGQDGWFSTKAAKKAEELRTSMKIAQAFQDNSINNNQANLEQDQALSSLVNSAAYGGTILTMPNKYKEGGVLFSNGADWSNGLIIINNGGTHEQNPLEGVPMGMDDQGKPNLVEEGEVIWNNYVFSNRIPIPDELAKSLKIQGKNMTFADAAKKAQKESAERPNDPISRRGLQASMARLQAAQEALKQQFAGQEEVNSGQKFSGGGTLRERLSAIDLSGFPLYANYVHPEGSTAYGFRNKPANVPAKDGGGFAYYKDGKYDQGYLDFVKNVNDNDAKVISDYIKDYTGRVLTPAELRANATDIGKSGGGYGVAHQMLGQLYNNSINTPTTDNKGEGTKGTYEWGLGPGLDNFWQAQGKADNSNNKELINALANGRNPWEALTHYDTAYVGNQGVIKPPPITVQAPPPPPKDPNKDSALAYLRYAPAVGAGLGVVSDLMGLTNKPDYTNADFALNSTSGLKDVQYNPIGDYMKYTPLDREFYINQLNAQAGSTRRAITNNSGGNRGQAMAGILAADYGAQGQLGQLARQAEEYNLGQRERVATFNRGTNMFNSENDLKAQIANNSNKELQVKAALTAAQMRDAADARASAGRSANLTNLFDSLGNIGIDTVNRQDRDRLIRAGVFGTLSQRPHGWSDARWQAYQNAVQGKGYKANGGRIKTRKKKGLTI